MEVELNGATGNAEGGNERLDGRRNGSYSNRRQGFEGTLQIPVIEPWPEPVDGSGLLDRMVETLRQFVILPKWAAETLALWVLHTYAFQLRDVTAYIGLESPAHRCGKTTLVTVLSELAHRAVVASNVSSPALFRVIEEMQPTLLIDEADTFLQGNEELRGILNSGNKSKTAYVLRVVNVAGQNGNGSGVSGPGTGLGRFSCWCPKLISRIGRLPVTLADRCILIQMQRKTGREKCERLRKLQPDELKRQCARFVEDHTEAIKMAEPQIPCELNDRAADIWELLLAVADLAGGRWASLAREAAVGLAGSAEENNPIGALLLDILVYFTVSESERVFSRTLVAELNTRCDPVWAELRKGKELTEMSLARVLRSYGVRPRTIWIGETSAKGYVKDDFNEVFRRYITKSQLEALRAEIARGEMEKNKSPEGKESEAPMETPNDSKAS